MKIVVLDHPQPEVVCTPLQQLRQRHIVEIYTSTTLSELLSRCLDASAVVSFAFPLRREVLDYITRLRHIFVPRDQVSAIVEYRIAMQLGLLVHEISPLDEDPCRWAEEIAIDLTVDFSSDF